MQFKLIPHTKNLFPKKGLLIRGASPLVWLQELQFLNIELNDVEVFPIPSQEINILFGCLVVFKNFAPSEIGKNSYVQCIENRFFVPEFSIIYPKLLPSDLAKISDKYSIMHPDFGFVRLNEEFDWQSILNEPSTLNTIVKKPSNGISIPKEITSFMVELSDEKVMKTLQPQKSEEEWMKDLPFDLQKVLAGNKKEAEKYLKYIEKYPERALDLGIPLDTLGTLRDDDYGKFKFASSFWEKILMFIFGKIPSKFQSRRSSQNNQNNSEPKGDYASYETQFPTSNKKGLSAFSKIILSLAAVLVLFFFFRDRTTENKVYDEAPSKNTVENVSNSKNNTIAFESGTSEIDLEINSIYGEKRKKLMDEAMLASVLIDPNVSDELKKRYRENGVRSLGEVQKDIIKLRDEIDISKDSLKGIYNEKIDKIAHENEEIIKKKVKDSLVLVYGDASVDPLEFESKVRRLTKKKTIALKDSLSQVFGTVEKIPEPSFSGNQNPSNISVIENSMPKKEHKVGVLNIAFVVFLLFFVAAVLNFLSGNKRLDTGFDSFSGRIRIIYMLILGGMLVYLFYPLINTFGYNLFFWLTAILVVILLYYLLNENKNILKANDE